ncbi:helix-turn-helix transcriptional regulator [Pantoea allii]|uniref:helix-turn-helix transcriptional regulator n=1 Tax=Pantoea allii TaxID=574096 RepID=UPI0024B83228|nr:AlpA family transcriptional regulator [Pantoea allii]MDJ0040924.1 AlpA family transcriptional regulator [Pantoea allii]
MNKNLIRITEVQRRIGYSKAWIYRLLKDSRFPKPVKIGTRAIAFVESEVDEWIEQRIVESRVNIA